MYEIVYKGEVVDTTETMDVALYLQSEYSSAFKSEIEIRTVEVNQNN